MSSKKLFIAGFAAGILAAGVTLSLTAIGGAATQRSAPNGPSGIVPPSGSGAVALVSCCHPVPDATVIDESGFTMIKHPLTGIYCFKASSSKTKPSRRPLVTTVLADESTANPLGITADWSRTSANCSFYYGQDWYEIGTFDHSGNFSDAIGFEVLIP